jgi:N-acetylneuraminic acid mutarotase
MKYSILFLICFILSLTSFAQLEWKSRASLPEFGIDLASSFKANGNMYVGTGRKADNSYSKELWEYNPSTNIWTKKTDYPGNGSNQCIYFSIGNKGYIGMGSSTTARHTDFYEYNSTTDAWTAKASFPGGIIYSAASFVIGDTAYVVGGSCGGTTCYKNTLWMYVSSTDSWTQRANFPGGKRATTTAFSLGNNGYAGQGVSSSHTLSNNFWKYTPSTNTWTSIATYPGAARLATNCFVKDGLAFVGCGQTGYSSPTRKNDFYAYNSSTNSWTNYTSNNDFTARIITQVQAISDSTILIATGRGDYGLLPDLWQLKLDYDTCDYFDTTFVQDTTFVKDTAYINDTTFVQDTTFIQDTLFINETTEITTYDTSYVTVYDTITEIRFDTTLVYITDTLYQTIYDTTWITTYDTAYTTINTAVEDTLIVRVYTDNCGNVLHKIYPNPTNDFLYLSSNGPDCFKGYNVQFIDALGKVLETKEYGDLVTFDIRGYARSLYFIRLIGSTGDTVFSKKIVIR